MLGNYRALFAVNVRNSTNVWCVCTHIPGRTRTGTLHCLHLSIRSLGRSVGQVRLLFFEDNETMKDLISQGTKTTGKVKLVVKNLV